MRRLHPKATGGWHRIDSCDFVHIRRTPAAAGWPARRAYQLADHPHLRDVTPMLQTSMPENPWLARTHSFTFNPTAHFRHRWRKRSTSFPSRFGTAMMLLVRPDPYFCRSLLVRLLTAMQRFSAMVNCPPTDTSANCCAPTAAIPCTCAPACSALLLEGVRACVSEPEARARGEWIRVAVRE